MFFGHRRSYTKMLNPCYESIAKGYVIPYDGVANRANLKKKVRKMLDTDGPYLLECAIKEEADVLPMTPPGKSVNEMLLEL